MLLDYNIGYVKMAASIKAVLVLWREGIMSRRGVMKHFFTKQELRVDLIQSVTVEVYQDQAIVPWFFTSD